MSKDVTVEVFYSKTCPNCPAQKDLANQFRDEENVKIKMTDVANKNNRAKNHGVRAVPTTVVAGPGIGQKTGFRGVMAEEKLETAIEVAKGEKDPEELENPGIVDKLRELL
ncbi:MAG: thioredoxin family protein [Candidatus Nanohalobium sp.]